VLNSARVFALAPRGTFQPERLRTPNGRWSCFPHPLRFVFLGTTDGKKARSFVRLSDVTKLQAIAVNFTSQEDREAPDVLGS